MSRNVAQHSTQSKGRVKPQYPRDTVRSGEPGHVDTIENAIGRVVLERSRARQALQVLTGKLIEAQEEERKRIGRELHDGLNQQLAMLAVDLGLLARQAPAEATALIESIINLRHRAESLSDDLRHISHQLHPVALEHLGLHCALRSLCGEFTEHSGLRVWFSLEEKEMKMERVRPDISICLYRIAQEALRNVVKHSCASEAWIRISHNHNYVQLYIIDKGAGFNLKSGRTSGLGLVSMEERVQIMQGQFHIESAPAEGTAIRITIPVTWKEQESANE